MTDCRGALCLPARARCSWSPTCISRRARPSPSAACCCRLTIRAATLALLGAADRRAMRPATVDRARRQLSRPARPTSGSPRAISRRSAQLQRGRDWFWITGNHDPDVPPTCSAGRSREHRCLHGSCSATSRRAVRRRARSPATCIPCARMSHARPLGAPALLRSDGQRCVMPAFGAYTGALNVLDGAFRPVPGRHHRTRARHRADLHHRRGDAAAGLTPTNVVMPVPGLIRGSSRESTPCFVRLWAAAWKAGSSMASIQNEPTSLRPWLSHRGLPKRKPWTAGTIPGSSPGTAMPRLGDFFCCSAMPAVGRRGWPGDSI